MLAPHAQEIHVRFAEGRQSSLWIVVRGQDANPADEDDVRMIVDSLRRQNPPRFSVCLACFGGGYELHQDIGAALAAYAFPEPLPIIAENLRNGGLIVTDSTGRQILDPAPAARLFKEALRWCAADYSDVLAEFADQIDARDHRSAG